MTFYTIGYGGRRPEELLELLTRHAIRSVADVRIRPDRSSMGTFSRARTPEKGIERLLATAGIAYHPILELGNLFLERDDWREPYRKLLHKSGELLVARLDTLPAPFCLLCAEKRVADCHRLIIAEYLVATRGWDAKHIE